MEELSNEVITLKVSSIGAEMTSIYGKKSMREYLWQGDAAYWGRQSPTLFPQVGGLWDGECRFNNEVYHIKKHGFASDTQFECIRREKNSLCYRMADTEETRKSFPFAFELESTFSLDNNVVEVLWTVHNPNKEDMPFHIGGHPGLVYPGFNAEEKIHGYFRFDSNEAPESASVGRKGCLGPERYKLNLQDDGLLPITDECFSNDAIILDRNQVHRIELLDRDKKPVATVESQAEVTLLWSPYGINAPFVCVEPWYGLCDSEDYHGEFKDRPYTNIVPAGGCWQAGFTIILEQETY